MGTQKTIVTQSVIEPLKTWEAEIAENLAAHANTTLSKAHGWELIKLTSPFYDAYSNDLSSYRDSGGDIVGYNMLRLTHSNVNYYIPISSSTLPGQNSTTGIGSSAGDVQGQGDTAWVTDFSTDAQSTLMTVNNQLLLPHTRLGHWEAHTGGVFSILPQVVNDSVGHRVGNYVAKLVYKKQQLLVPCDTRLGGPIQAPRLASAYPTVSFTGSIHGTFNFNGAKLTMSVSAGAPWPTSVIIAFTGIAGTYPINVQWNYSSSSTGPWLPISTVGQTVPGSGNGGLTSVSGYTASVVGPAASANATSVWSIAGPGGDNSNTWYMQAVFSNSIGTVSSVVITCYIKDSAGSWLCTVLWKKGDISTEIYEADRRYTLKHVSRAAKEGYTLWAYPLSIQMLKHEWVYKLLRPFVLRWTRHMAHKSGLPIQDSIAGKVIFDTIRPLCALIGWPILRYRRWARRREITANRAAQSIA